MASSKKPRLHLRAWVIFFLGTCFGCTIFLFVYGQKIDHLLLERSAIYYANNQKYMEIQKLQKEIEQLGKYNGYTLNSEARIQKIAIEIIHRDIIGVEAIKEQINRLLSPFIGKSSQVLSQNPDLVAAVLEQKEISLDTDTHVKISVKYLSFHHATLRIWVQLHFIK